MASKEAHIYIVDQGQTTRDKNNGRIETDLEYAMTYVWDKITSAMATGRKTFSIGVIGLRTDDTNIPTEYYEQEKSDGFENLSRQKDLGQVLMPDLRNLQQVIRPSTTIAGDALSAIALAVDLVNKYTRNAKGVLLKYERKIVLVTDGKGLIDNDAAFINGLTLQINQSDIELVVLGVDFDDPEYGFKEEDKDIIKNQNEAILRELVADCTKGSYGTIAEALEDIAIPRPKKTKPYRSYLGKLTLGNLVEYPDTAVSIDVERYFGTKTAKPPSASSFAVRPDTANGQASTQSTHTVSNDTDRPDVPPEGGPMTAVKNLRTYKVKLEGGVGGWQDLDVSPEELEKGYEYGSTAVHIAASDENITKLETIQSFSIIGFIPMDKYERYLNMGESCVTIAQQTNDKARMALSSLIHALFELESYAVARIVLKDGKDPAIVLLAPSIEPELESLIDVPLPFAEDVRPYRFPPLDRVITTTGAVLDKHRNLPTKDLMDSMSDYVDSMDLSTFSRDNEGEPTEYMTFDESYAPLIHRLDQAIRKRASHPDEEIKPVPDVLMKWTAPPPKLVKQSQSHLNKLTKAADVKKVPPKVKGKRGGRDKIKPLSGLDIDALLSGKGEQQKITPDNSIPEFKRMLANSNADSVVEDAAKQMGNIILDFLSGAHLAMGNSGDDRALENLRVMREEMISFEFDETYNKFIRNLKNKVVKDELGGSVKDFWLKVKFNHLGLINSKEGSSSKVDEQEAKEFYSLSSELPTRSKP